MTAYQGMTGEVLRQKMRVRLQKLRISKPVLIKGDRVILITDRHGYSRNNPFINSVYSCEGTISNFNPENDPNLPFSVEWDNKKENSYAAKDLKKIESNSICKSIW